MLINMKDKAQRILQGIIVFLLLSAQGVFAQVQSKECEAPLVLSTSMDWYPYLYVNGEGRSTGADVELLRKILATMGCELSVVHFPERRSIYELKKGNFDVWLGASLNKERALQYYYSAEYRHEVNKFVYQKSDTTLAKVLKFQDIIALNKIIAVNLAGWYGEEIERSKKHHNNYIYSETVTKRLKMLSLNRVDVVMDDYTVLCSELSRQPDENLIIHPLAIFKTPIYYMFNKKTVSENFVNQFNAVLAEMRTTGQLDSHFAEFFPKGCDK